VKARGAGVLGHQGPLVPKYSRGSACGSRI
jgi:hypothetical protein